MTLLHVVQLRFAFGFGARREKLVDQQRRHVTAKRRSVLNERQISDVSSLAIARNLLAHSPSRRLRRVELREQVRELIERLSEQHRELLLLRHVEGLSNAEVADLLGMTPTPFDSATAARCVSYTHC